MGTLMYASVLLLLSPLLVTWSAPLPDGQQTPLSAGENEQDLAKKYLKTYYNMSSRSIGRSSNSALSDKIKEMQVFFGLNVTGHLDGKTLEIMKLSRCGVPDVGNYNFMPSNQKWKSGVVTYRVVNYTPDLQPTDVDQAIARALSVWSSASPLTFTKIDSGEADIMISFQNGDHSDFNPFDGPRGTLAHAFSPGTGIGGDAHFDEAETWSTSSNGINLFLVAVHEFGHSLGLSHSSDPAALMFPTYKYVDTANYKLPEDDTKGIQALYGVPTVEGPTVATTTTQAKTSPKANLPLTTQPTATPKGDETCTTSMRLDAATVIRDQVYMIKDGVMWVKQPSKAAVKSSVQTLWQNMPTPIDAVYTAPSGYLVLFKGRQFWAFHGKSLARGFPKDISALRFPNSVNKIDAAVYLPEARATLFFVADKYYRFSDRSQGMDRSGPKSIEASFPGVGTSVDAAFYLDGFLYFSSGANLSKYDVNKKKVIQVWSIKDWIGC